MTVEELKAAVAKLELKAGDIVLVEINSVPLGTAIHLAEMNLHNLILGVDPAPGMTLEEVVRTCTREHLQQALAMTAEGRAN